MNVGDKVKFLNNQNELGEECELKEDLGTYCRIEKPNGEILRIFKDRLRSSDTADNKKLEVKEGEKLDPWSNLPDDGEVWVKGNRFNDTTVCETVAIIMPRQGEYLSINTYNGIAKKVMNYPLKNYSALVKRMNRKEYVKQERPNS